MNNEARELNLDELNEVHGGFWAFVAGVAAGVVGNAVYDFMKSHQGTTDAINYIKDQAGK